MIERLDQILVVSDIDNTLLSAQKGMPACNATVIKLFCRLGGRFTVATGRTVHSVARYLDSIPLTAPAITYGGGMLYDFAENRPTEQHFLNRQAAYDTVRAVLEQFPTVGLEVMAENGRIYVVNPNLQVIRHTYEEKLDYVVARLEDLPQNWYKVLFADSPAALAPVRQFAQTLLCPELQFVQTNTVYYEIMPAGVNKGSALHSLCRLVGVGAQDTFAIGDYYNDLELLKAAGHPVAVGNAVPEVKMLCEEVVLPCMNGGVGQLLYRLIKQYT